jgi:hypothetical protein
MGPQNGEPFCPCRMRAAETHFGSRLFLETSKREQAEEELECLRMFLDKHRVPTKHDGIPLSLVGRVMFLVNMHLAGNQH